MMGVVAVGVRLHNRNGFLFSGISRVKRVKKCSKSLHTVSHLASIALLHSTFPNIPLPIYLARTWYTHNLEELKLLNPEMKFMIRTVDNAMPAVTTELEWTMDDLLRFMIQEGKFRDANGSVSGARVDAAKDYMKIDWEQMIIERFQIPGFDPEKPGLDEERPGWRDEPEVQNGLSSYFAMKNAMDEQMKTFQGGPNDEFERAKNALLMCQRVDLWCAGPKEVERAVVHLYKLGRAKNDRVVDYPLFIQEFTPGCDDMQS